MKTTRKKNKTKYHHNYKFLTPTGKKMFLFCAFLFVAVHCLNVNVSVEFALANGTVESYMAIVDGQVQSDFIVANINDTLSGHVLAPDVVNVTIMLRQRDDDSDAIEFMISRDVVGGESKPHHEPLDGADLSYDLPGGKNIVQKKS